jgi:translation initiation factor IF-2
VIQKVTEGIRAALERLLEPEEVEEGLECGVVLEGDQDVKVGDVLELFETKQVEQTLEWRHELRAIRAS